MGQGGGQKEPWRDLVPPGLGKPMKGPISFIDGLSALPCSYLFLRPVVYLPGEMEAVEVVGRHLPGSPRPLWGLVQAA